MAGRRHVLADGDRINSGASDAELASLVAGLNDLGIHPHPDELADALWLARWAPAAHQEPAGEQAGEQDGAPQGDRRDPAGRAARTPSQASGGNTPARGTRLPPALTAELAVPGRPAGPGRGDGTDPGGADAARSGRVRVPTAAVLPQPLALQRALRPLRAYRAPARTAALGVLDERRTADRAADTGIVVPVLGGSRRRTARVQFVMDLSTSMVVWEETLQELRQICERSGAFREVRVHYVRQNAAGEAAIALSAAPGAPLHRPEELRDPTGHRLTLVLSDCAGPLWRAGKMQRLLHGWAATAPVAVVQPLPQRMWRRTHLPALQGELLRAEGPAGRLEFRPATGPAVAGGALPIPVLAPRPGPLRAWVRLVSGATGQSLRTVAGWVREDHPASAAPRRTDREVPARDRVRAFRRTSSPDAARLAVYLAATPLVLPVMRLVQRAMLPDSGPEVLAEVLLGGLLRRADDLADDLPGYEFVDGVQQELLEQIAVSDAHLVLKHCSAYLESRYGRTARNFPALAAAYLSGEARESPPGRPATVEEGGLRAFARVSADVLRRFGQRVPVAAGGGDRADELIARVRELLSWYASDHTFRDLDEAIGLLRASLDEDPENAGGPHAELGAALLLRWQARQTVEDLRGALEEFERTAESDRAPGVLLDWYTALVAVAAEVTVAGLDAAALPDFVRDRAAEPYPEQRVLIGLHEQAVWCLETAAPLTADQAAHVYPELLRTLQAMASWGADAAFTGLLEREHGGPGEWTARLLAAAVAAALSDDLGQAVDELTRTEYRAGLLLDQARHLLDEGEVRWSPTPDELTRGRRQAGRAVRTYRELVLRLYEARGEAPDFVPGAFVVPGEALAATAGEGAEGGTGGTGGTGEAGGTTARDSGGATGPDVVGTDRYVGSAADRDAGGAADRDAGPGPALGRDPDGVLRQDREPVLGRAREPVLGRDRESAHARDRDRVLRPVLDLDHDPAFHSDHDPALPDSDRAPDPDHGPQELGRGDEFEGPIAAGAAVGESGVVSAEASGVGTGQVSGDATGQVSGDAAGEVSGGVGGAAAGALTAEALVALDRRLASALLGLAAALELAGDGDHDAEAERLAALRRALRLTGDDLDLRTLTLQHLAWALADAYARTGDRAHLDEEIDAWWSSLAGLEQDGEFYPYALKSLGDALIEAAEWDDAVRMMREAVDSTADADPALAARRMALGHALLTRYLVRGGQADLHEADWMLGAAARGSEGTEIAAASWQLRAQVAEEQARRGRSSDRWHDAADYYRRAADNAEESDRPEIAAAARHHRAQVLERVAGPGHALAEYTLADRLYLAVGRQDTTEADEVRAAIRRLTTDGAR